jgi:4-amino-4-deoxy-L-arabinose transferase-like glycosyltransferase
MLAPVWSNASQIIALILAAIALRLWYLWQYGNNLPYLGFVIGDSEYYDLWARRIASGVGYESKPFYTGPLYPYLLGFFYVAAGKSLYAVAFMQAAAGVLNILLVYGMGRSIFSHATGLLAALITLLYGPILFLESKILTETLAIALNCLAVLLLTTSLKRPSNIRFFISGVALGAAALCRPGTLLAAALILAWLVLRHPRRQTFVWPRRAAIFAAGLALVIMPVTFRNYLTTGDLVLISTNGGTTFLYGNNPAAGGLMATPAGFSGEMQIQQQEETVLAERALGRPLSPSETSRYAFHQGLRIALAKPLKYLLMLAKKVLWFFHAREAADGYTYNLYLERRFVPILRVLFLPFPLIAVSALFGILCLRTSRAMLFSTPALLFAGATFATMIIFAVNSRYRAPIVPFLAVFGAYGMLNIPRAFLRENLNRSMTIAAISLVIISASFVSFPLPKVPVDTLSNLGVAYANAGKWEGSKTILEEARRREPENPRVHFNLGLLFLKMGKVPEAIEAFKEVTRIQPENVAAHSRLVSAFVLSGRFDDARHEADLVQRLRDRAP